MAASSQPTVAAQQSQNVMDLLGLDIGGGAPAAPQGGGMDDLLGGGGGGGGARAAPKPVLLPAARGKGLTISGMFSSNGGRITHDLTFDNQTGQPLSNFAIQYNKNSFGFAPSAALQIQEPLHHGQSASASVPIATNGARDGGESLIVQIAVRTSLEVFYFQDAIPVGVILSPDGRLEKQQFLQMWKSISDANEQTAFLNSPTSDIDGLVKKLETKSLFFIARRAVENQAVVYLSSKTVTGTVMLVELTFTPGSQTKCCVKSEAVQLGQLLCSSMEGLMQ
jgi:AP-1 complex subunit beta-1